MKTEPQNQSAEQKTTATATATATEEKRQLATKKNHLTIPERLEIIPIEWEYCIYILLIQSLEVSYFNNQRPVTLSEITELFNADLKWICHGEHKHLSKEQVFELLNNRIASYVIKLHPDKESNNNEYGVNEELYSLWAFRCR